MNGAAILLVTATLGVDFGWKSLPNDEVEYIIQIEPALLESLENGEPIASELLPEVRGNVRRFRVQIGSAPLPREAVMRRLRPRTSDVAVEEPAAKQAKHEAPAIPAPKLDVGPGPKLDAGPPPKLDAHPPEPERYREPEPAQVADSKTAAVLTKASDSPPAESKPQSLADTSASSASSLPGRSDHWLIGGAVALFVSLGANLYLGWLLTTIRRNYHQLVDSLYARNTTSSAV
jgi:hypothetical protein